MAFVTIKNALVTKAKKGGRGYTVEEQFTKNDGTEGKTKWQIWFDEEDQLTEGQRVNLSGIYSSKVDSFENSEGAEVQYVERSVNKARLQDEQPEQDPAGDEPF
jgi:hypothetical protein